MQTSIANENRQGILIFCISFVLAIISYHFIFSEFFPNKNEALGHDYAYFLPQLLSGYYWFLENSLFEIPWFTPAFCGGLPFLPNPQGMFYSVPQFLTFAIDPLASIYITFIVFASIGFIGFYKLSTEVFCLKPIIAVYGASLFMFNGFYTYRMIIGHLTCHAFMLIPLIAYLLLRSHTAEKKPNYVSINILLAGVLIAYFIHSGFVNFIVPAMITIVGIWALSVICNGSNYVFWPRIILASVIGLLLSSAKLTSSILFLSYFPRDLYTLPGIEGVGNVLLMFLKSLFLNTSSSVDVANTKILFQQHSFEFGITIIPLIIIMIFLLWMGILYYKNRARSHSKIERPLLVAGFILIIVMLIPIAINYYSPAWNIVLKNTPYIKNSSSLFRWMAIDIPLIILISSIMLKKLELKTERVLIPILIICAILINLVSDKSFYHNQPYSPNNIIDAYNKARTSQEATVIDKISVYITAERKVVSPVWRNDSMVMGGSQLLCYEPIFGYGLEELPFGDLHPGSPMAEQDGYLNLKNPACYLYGTVNSCTPGDHFSVEQIDRAKAFLNYHPFDYKIPMVQNIANMITKIAIILMLLVFTHSSICIVKRAKVGG